jgi:hypothetical protein
MHQLKEADMVSAKLDLIMKKLEARDTMKKEVMHISDSYMTCEECGDVGHSGVNCPEFLEDVNYINNTTTIILSRINEISNKGQTIKVITKITFKVIIIIAITIKHL